MLCMLICTVANYCAMCLVIFCMCCTCKLCNVMQSLHSKLCTDIFFIVSVCSEINCPFPTLGHVCVSLSFLWAPPRVRTCVRAYICRVSGQEGCPERLLLKSVAALSNILSTEAEVSGCRRYCDICHCLSAPLWIMIHFNQCPLCPYRV